MKTLKTILKIILIVYFAVFYLLSWGGVCFWIMNGSEIKQIYAITLGLILIFFPIMVWVLQKDLKKDSR